MKIVIIGTSNSVMGNKGFLQFLGLSHEVVQLSSGRISFYNTLKTIMVNKEVIESCDLLFVDHYINDLNFYRKRLGAQFDEYCKLFYQYLSSLNVHVFNLLFPIKDLAKREHIDYYHLVVELSKQYNITTIDLNKIVFPEHVYTDEIHINYNASYALGIILNNQLNQLNSSQKPKGGWCKSNPFSVVSLPSYSNEVNKAEKYSNSLISINYLVLKQELKINRPEQDILIAIGYLKPFGKQGESGIKINNQIKIGFSQKGYFLESLDFHVQGPISLKPLRGNFNLPTLMHRGKANGKFSYTYLNELVFYNPEINLDCHSAERKLFNIDMSQLLDVLNRLSPSPSELINPLNLAEETIEVLRDTAISFEDKNIKVSKDLMELAHQAHPSGPLIKKKLSEYKSKLK